MTSVSVFRVGCQKQLSASCWSNHEEDGLLRIWEAPPTLFAIIWLDD